MIYFTGDTHGDRMRFFDDNMPGESTWTENDFLIVCGDFGFVFLDTEEENAFLDMLAQKPYTICFCDGNHENFPRIYKYPEQSWHGGRVHKIRDNILHLMRGYVFDIEGKKIFAMGGGYSRDKEKRKEGFSWWWQELPSNSQYRNASVSLRECGFAVDYIVTHTAPRQIIRQLCKTPDEHEAELTGFLDWVRSETRFDRWFFGHFHTDAELGGGFRALWFDVVQG